MIPKALIPKFILALALSLLVIHHQPAYASTLNWSVTCSSLSLNGTVSDIDGASITFTLDIPGIHYGYRLNRNFPGPFSVTASFAPLPPGSPINVTAATEEGSLFSGAVNCVAPAATVSTANTSPPAPHFFNPGDGRVDPKPSDRVAVWCNPPDGLGIYGITPDGHGVSLGNFTYSELVAAGSTGITTNRGEAGAVTVRVDSGNNFFVSWNGGTFQATGVGDFAKSFTCAFNTIVVDSANLAKVNPAPTARPTQTTNNTASTNNTSTSASCSPSHVVQPGENLFRIAVANGTTWPVLAQLNGITDPNQLSVGQVICLPPLSQ